jgi:hypothetical protein
MMGNKTTTRRGWENETTMRRGENKTTRTTESE